MNRYEGLVVWVQGVFESLRASWPVLYTNLLWRRKPRHDDTSGGGGGAMRSVTSTPEVQSARLGPTRRDAGRVPHVMRVVDRSSHGRSAPKPLALLVPERPPASAAARPSARRVHRPRSALARLSRKPCPRTPFCFALHVGHRIEKRALHRDYRYLTPRPTRSIPPCRLRRSLGNQRVLLQRKLPSSPRSARFRREAKGRDCRYALSPCGVAVLRNGALELRLCYVLTCIHP